MPVKLFALGLFVFLATSLPVQAQTSLCNQQALSAPMKATFHQAGDRRILLLAGGIEANSGEVVGAAIRNTRAYQEVWLCSGGGAVKGGIAIGKALNRARSTARVPDNFFCASACTIAFMGGYARIIDKNARFVTHASSGAMSFGVKFSDAGLKFSNFAFYKCDTPWIASYCQQLRGVFEKLDLYNKVACATPQDVHKLNTKCVFFDTSKSRYADNIIIANSQLTQIIGLNKSLTQAAISIEMRSSLQSELDLLHYFQTMLLDGKASYTKASAYQQIKRQLVPTNIYALKTSDSYYRSLDKDMASLAQVSGDISQSFAVWQTMLTDSELSLKTQITDYIRDNNIDLGLAATDAIKMYDAMRTCQIQSSCQLEPHTARSLGYHNMYGYE
ncbi:hypothetical protein [Alteromonas halophila]|uniref:Uncharacterized protein n=1 Tax=Alteromonas halophila TaxID=516698 RepID=A0A918JFJ6_9ALTE|nr:hypothetical protein [Alteromonas halophila]GGW78287.1 hypothetical protein GCM10007391_08570 [Alteromonas halophila]